VNFVGICNKYEVQLKLPGLGHCCEYNGCGKEVDYDVLRHQELKMCEKCFLEWSLECYQSGKSEEVLKE